jgi:hypothetical protein
MAKLLASIRWPGAAPTVSELCSRYHLAEADFDQAFGVVEVDPEQHLFGVLLEEAAANKLGSAGFPEISSPQSNPRIDTFDLQ